MSKAEIVKNGTDLLSLLEGVKAPDVRRLLTELFLWQQKNLSPFEASNVSCETVNCMNQIGFATRFTEKGTVAFYW